MTVQNLREGVLASIAGTSKDPLGRTAFMKLLYILQEVRGVPLNYNFRLYTYGPFDAEVLEDLDIACRDETLDSFVFEYPGGYGYKISPGTEAEQQKVYANDFRDEVEWVVEQFSNRSAADLEMISTIIFASKMLSRSGFETDDANIAAKVCSIKPHIPRPRVEEEIRGLREQNLLA